MSRKEIVPDEIRRDILDSYCASVHLQGKHNGHLGRKLAFVFVFREICLMYCLFYDIPPLCLQ
jgi:hypothetical protein